MSKYVSIDFFDGTVTSGVVEMRNALDCHPMPVANIEGELTTMPTAHTWPEMSILLHPDLTLDQIEERVMACLDIVYDEFERLRAFAANTNNERDSQQAELVLQARGVR